LRRLPSSSLTSGPALVRETLPRHISNRARLFLSGEISLPATSAPAERRKKDPLNFFHYLFGESTNF
jgi:hypothetical protein